MKPTSMMRHRVDVWRPSYVQETSQTIDGYSRVYRSVPAFIQPASSSLTYFYALRGTEITHTIYTTDTSKTFRREDVVEYQGRQFHLEADGIKALESDVYIQLICKEWPEDGKKKLDRQEYA